MLIFDPLGEIVSKNASVTFLVCTVPNCENNTIVTPEKIFYFVPFEPTLCSQWLRSVNIDLFPELYKACMSRTHYNIFICEDHFSTVKKKLASPYPCFIENNELKLNSQAGVSKLVHYDHNYANTFNKEQDNIITDHNKQDTIMNYSYNPNHTNIQTFEINNENPVLNGESYCSHIKQEYEDTSEAEDITANDLNKEIMFPSVEEEHLDVKPEMYQCNKCPSSFINESEILVHIKSAHQNKKVEDAPRWQKNNQKNSCTMNYEQSQLNTLKPVLFECRQCLKLFLYKRDVLDHNIECHKDQCDVLGVYREKKDLELKMKKAISQNKELVNFYMYISFSNVCPKLVKSHRYRSVNRLDKVHPKTFSSCPVIQSSEEINNENRVYNITANTASEKLQLLNCKMCSIFFSNEADMQNHFRTIHKVSEYSPNNNGESYYTHFENFVSQIISEDKTGCDTNKEIDTGKISIPGKTNTTNGSNFFSEATLGIKQETLDNDDDFSSVNHANFKVISEESLDIKLEKQEFSEDSESTVSVHLDTHPCTFCTAEYIDRYGLRAHVIEKHNNLLKRRKNKPVKKVRIVKNGPPKKKKKVRRKQNARKGKPKKEVKPSKKDKYVCRREPQEKPNLPCRANRGNIPSRYRI